MFNNLQNGLLDASEEDILAAGGEVKETAPAKKTATKDTKPADKTDTKTSKDTPATSVEVTDLSDDELANAFGDDDAEEEKAEPETEKADADDDSEENPEEDDDKEEKDKTKSTTEEPSAVDTAAFLKARAELLLKKGEWAEWEGHETTEWDEEMFEKVELQQRAFQKEQMRNELLEGFGPYGKQIAEFTANGGNPDELIDIFKEQQKVQGFSLDTDADKIALIKHYRVNVLEESDKQAERYIKNLVADKELDEDATATKALLDKQLKKEADALQQEQLANKQQFEKSQKDARDKLITDVDSVLKTRTDIPADEQAELRKMLTNFNKELANGTKVNDFYFKFAEFRKNPANYVELARFINNPEKFKKSLVIDGKNEVSDKAFKLALGANKAKKSKSVSEISPSSSKQSTFKLY